MAGVGTTKVFENDKIIVWEFVLGPGETTPMHTHQHDYIFTEGGWIAQAWAQSAPEPAAEIKEKFAPEQSKRAPEQDSPPTAQPEQGMAKVPAPSPPRPLPPRVSPDLNDVVFIDAKRGWAVGSGGTMLSTPDGGPT